MILGKNVFGTRVLRYALLASVLALFLLAWLLVPGLEFRGWFSGYLLGLFAVILHFFMSWLLKSIPAERMMVVYFLGMAVRFLVVIALFILFVISEKFDQLSFTVSFLISYLLHSLIDLISVYQSLANRSHDTKHPKHLTDE